MSNHTPGSWYVDGFDIMTADGKTHVAQVNHSEDDARLIASAPDLLCALSNLHHICELALADKLGRQYANFETRHGTFVGASDAMQQAELAIAKAKGV